MRLLEDRKCQFAEGKGEMKGQCSLLEKKYTYIKNKEYEGLSPKQSGETSAVDLSFCDSKSAVIFPSGTPAAGANLAGDPPAP